MAFPSGTPRRPRCTTPRSLERFEKRHFRAFAVLLAVLIGFAVVLYLTGNHLAEVAGPTLENLESASSP
jgi:hypothetical protein